jgi:predicted DNA-binding antitoxin AbrB/MazE fold protein
MEIFKLAQKVDVAIGQKEWIDIATNQYEKPLREYAKRIKEHNPEAILGLRMIEETKLKL